MNVMYLYPYKQKKYNKYREINPHDLKYKKFYNSYSNNEIIKSMVDSKNTTCYLKNCMSKNKHMNNPTISIYGHRTCPIIGNIPRYNDYIYNSNRNKNYSYFYTLLPRDFNDPSYFSWV